MKPILSVGLQRSKRRVVVLFAWLMSAAVLQPASAEVPRFEEGVSGVEFHLVYAGSREPMENALAAMDAMRDVRDPNLAGEIKTQFEMLKKDRVALGRVGQIRELDELHFGGCVEGRFRVLYERGEQTWTIDFREVRDGWRLARLQIHTNRS